MGYGERAIRGVGLFLTSTALGLFACGGTSESEVARSAFERLVAATCEWASECNCRPRASSGGCAELVGKDFALLQQRAGEQGWSFREDCVQNEVNVLKRLGCRPGLSSEEIMDVRQQLECKYYSGKAPDGQACTTSFECAGDSWCDEGDYVCAPRPTIGTRGGECPGSVCVAPPGILWCDTRESAAGVCRDAVEAGEPCAIDVPNDDGTTRLLRVACRSDHYCEETSRSCQRSPGEGERCGKAYRVVAPVCAPDHDCRQDSLCHRFTDRKRPQPGRSRHELRLLGRAPNHSTQELGWAPSRVSARAGSATRRRVESVSAPASDS